MSPNIRPLGLFERWHLTREDLGLDSCVFCLARYSNDSNASLNQSLFMDALARVVRQYEALRVRVIDSKGPNPTFSSIPEDKIELSKVVNFLENNPSSLDDFAQEQLQIPFNADSGDPLWRVAVFPDQTVVFLWHHVIGDGLSSIAFHTSLLRALRAVSSEAGAASPEPSSVKLLPPLEEVIDVSPSYLTLFKVIMSMILPKSWFNRGLWSGPSIPATPKLEPQVRFIHFPPETSRALLTLCRQNQTTLTGYLHETAVSILSTLIDRSKYHHITTSVPVAYRAIAKIPQEAFCDHASAINMRPPAHSKFDWEEARKVSRTLKADLLKSAQPVGLLRYLNGDYEGYFKGKLGVDRELGLEVSNLGRISIPDSSAEDEKTGWKIEDMAFTQCNPIGPALSMGIVSAPSGRLTVTVRWPSESEAEDQFSEEFVRRLKDSIDNTAATT